MIIFWLVFAIAKKTNEYTVSYGSKKAPHKLVNYFDLGCKHCVDFYRDTFPEIRCLFCDTGKLLFVFKPYPIHQETLIYMECCEMLTCQQRQALFETLMEIDVPVSKKTIEQCMKILKRPFKMPSAHILACALQMTQMLDFTSLPVMFLNNKRLSDEKQDNLIETLQHHCQKQCHLT